MDYSAYEHLIVACTGRRATVTMNRPEMLNAVNSRLHFELARVWDDLQYDDDVDVVVLTGAGKAFSAGGDLPWLKAEFEKRDLRPVTGYEAKKLVFALLDFEKPVICRMNGDAIGLGATMALFCDIVIAVDSARIGDPHVKAGLVAGDGGAIIWPHLIGHARAKQYLMTGDLMDAKAAADMGLVNEAVPAEQLDGAVDKIATKLERGAAKAIRWTKLNINQGLKQQATALFDGGIAYELLSKQTLDHGEAVTSFVEKRAPKFTGA